MDFWPKASPEVLQKPREHSGLVPRDAVRGRIRPTYFPFTRHLGRPVGHLGRLLRTSLVRLNESSPQRSKGMAG